MGKGQSHELMVLRKVDSHLQKNETESLSYTMHKNQLNSDWNIRPETIKLLEEKKRQ